MVVLKIEWEVMIYSFHKKTASEMMRFLVLKQNINIGGSVVL